MSKTDFPGYLLGTLLLLFIGSFAFHGNLLGKTLSSAFVPVGEKADPKITLSEIEATSANFEEFVAIIQENPQKIKPLPPEEIDSETLWLARCIY